MLHLPALPLRAPPPGTTWSRQRPRQLCGNLFGLPLVVLAETFSYLIWTMRSFDSSETSMPLDVLLIYDMIFWSLCFGAFSKRRLQGIFSVAALHVISPLNNLCNATKRKSHLHVLGDLTMMPNFLLSIWTLHQRMKKKIYSEKTNTLNHTL